MFEFVVAVGASFEFADAGGPGVEVADWVHTEVRGWTLADLIDDDRESALLARAARELMAFVNADGPVAFTAPALVGTVAIHSGPN